MLPAIKCHLVNKVLAPTVAEIVCSQFTVAHSSSAMQSCNAMQSVLSSNCEKQNCPYWR